MPERIVLIGFMAAGKSTVGALLAERLGWSFVDFDALIEERTGLTPGRLIREQGEAELRRLEAVVTDSLSGCRRTVLAPGGGWATRAELVERLGPGTVRIWLRVRPEEALRRAADGVDRPLLGPVEGREQRAAALLRDREPAYRAAELEVDANERKPTVVVEEIVRRLELDREDDER